MDRGKSTQGTRGPKSKLTQQLPDSFIALGAKPGTSRDDPKRTIPLPKISVASTSSASTDKLKREGTSSNLAVPPSKKLKAGLSGVSRSGIVGASGSSLLPIDRMTGAGSPSVEPWESLAIDCEANDIFDKIMQSLQADNIDKTSGYILGIIKGLRSIKSKPCKITWSALLSVASIRPEIFTSENVVNAMANVLRRDIVAGAKGMHKSNSHVHQMLLNLICHAFNDKDDWPEIFVKLYVEDATGDRVIIDSPFAKPFVDNITAAFHTKVPPSSLLKLETSSSAPRDTSSPLTINILDDDDGTAEQKQLVENWQIKTASRYIHTQQKVEQIVLEAIKEILTRRQQPENISKNFVRLLSTASGLNEMRIIGVSRIEAWLHNHKLMKPAQELLAYLCYNCSASSPRDLEVIAQLSKLRLKNKQMVNYFNNCLREMVMSFQENLFPLLKYTIYNELSNARNPNNLIVVGALFQVKPDHAAEALADIFWELLLNKDDYHRSLRVLLKEINRVLRHDFNLLNVVHALLRERKELIPTMREHEHRERMFHALVDLSTMCMLLCVSAQVRDAATQSKRDLTVLKAFKTQVANIQRECVAWLQDSAVRMFRPTMHELHHSLSKILFLEQAEHYYKIDSWPGENERNLFLRLASEVPLLQATLLRVLLIGLSKDHPTSQTDMIDILDQLIKRAANLAQDCGPTLLIDKVEILEFFFNLCMYTYPDNITLPLTYKPPQMAITTLYWKVWLMLLILAAHNPLTIGSIAWNKYPTLRMFMEMCITNYFSFPPPTMIKPEEDYQSKELQIITVEKQIILEFETHLAAATSRTEITEKTSLLLPQLMDLNPSGEARRPPTYVIDMLQALNHSHRLGHLLCKSRLPDFLLDIMSRQGGTAHMPWLTELVHSSEGVLSHLPVQCLCEYLLSTAPAEKLTKHGQLLAHLRQVVNDPDSQSANEVLEYLFRRLTSDHAASRVQATKGLGLILSPTEDVEITTDNYSNWLSHYIQQFAQYNLIKPLLVQFLRQALQIESNPVILSSYINFLATQNCYESFAELTELITDLSSVIIERHSIASYVLPGLDQITLKNLLQLFCLYTMKAKENAEESYTIHEVYEYVVVSWETGEQCGMQPLLIHSAIVLLTYGPLSSFEPFNMLLNIWFPLNMGRPRAYSPDTAETTSYLPDWIKLRMIRSNVPRLVDAAIENLEPPKLVLFIQSFGIPTSSINKLLAALDKATMLDKKILVDSVLDKTYMIQLVEVQKKRNAVGGEIFVKSIEMQLPMIEDVDIGVNVGTKKPLHIVGQTEKNVLSEKVLQENFHLLFNPQFNGDKNKIILNLIKNVSLKKNLKDTFFTIINDLPINLVLSTILKCNSFSTLLRLIFSNDSFARDKQLLANQLLTVISHDNCTTNVLRHYLKSTTRKMNIEEKVSGNTMDMIIKEELVTCSKSELILNSHENLGQKLVKMLLEDDIELEKTGLLVDWLSILELEIANMEKDKLQVDLLFSRKQHHFRPLLMSLLLQRASWHTLHNLMTFLLSGDAFDTICPVSVLDYLTALTKSPKLWQGRDKAVPKHSHSEDVLRLSENQVNIVVKYILAEAELHSLSWEQKMESRLQLLLKCIKSYGSSIIKNLVRNSETNTYSRKLLLMTYMALPSAGQGIIVLKPEIASELLSINCPSAIDKISHCLFTAMSSTQARSKDMFKKSRDLELCARKLAATHPLLVLRHLPMLAVILKGRTQYDWNILKSRGHFLLFGQILGLIELLQPYIFFHPNSSALYELLESFFQLLQFHYQRTELNVMVKRIVTFILNWMVHDVRGGAKFLHHHGGILNNIQFNQPGVRPLLSSVSLPVTDEDTPSNRILVGAVSPPVQETYPERWQHYITGLTSSDRLNSLQEIDQLTKFRPQLLESVSQNLYHLLESPTGSVRSLALTLIIRWLKYNPKASSEALPTVLSCLNSENVAVVATLLEKLPELVTLMQEYGKVILAKVFQLGTNSVLDTTSSITKTIDLLNLQYGY